MHETMISQAAGQSHPIMHNIQSEGGVNKRDWRNLREKVHRLFYLVVGCYASNLLWNVAIAFDDRIKTLTWIGDDRVA